MPGILKIGRTERSVERRATELSSHTGVPTDFEIVQVYPVVDSVEAERHIHDRLSGYRVSENREFFRLSLEEATAAIENILGAALSTRERDFEREDQLLWEATIIVNNSGRAFPGLLVALLKIEYDEAEALLEGLKARGMLTDTNQCSSPTPEQDAWLLNEARNRRAQKALAQATEEAYEHQISQVNSLIEEINREANGDVVVAQCRRSGNEAIISLSGPEGLVAKAKERIQRCAEASASLNAAINDAKALLSSLGETAPLTSESQQEDNEAVIEQCIEVIRSEQKASVSLLQRRLKIGYGRAARIMDVLEERGYVGPSKGAEPRDILIDLDGERNTG